jgi:acetate kinase
MLSQNIQRILIVNTGSSSLKISLFEVNPAETRILSGHAERIGTPGGEWSLADARGATLVRCVGDAPDHRHALEQMLQWLREHRPAWSVHAIGHRIVHGGPDYRQPHRITIELIDGLSELIPIDPDHLPQALDAIQFTMQAWPDLPEVACFDTSFHKNMPRIAQIYPLPHRFSDAGVIRFGFHGLSYEYILQELRALAPNESEGRVVIAHLGNGASMVAVHHGIGIDTTMGFTPTGGLMMGTRAGDLDPGVLLHLLKHADKSGATLSDLVNRQAGLLGVSGISSDVRDLLDRAEQDERAAEAIALFCYLARKQLGGLVATLGGLETLVFTGGIGEHAAQVRWRICEGLEFFGIRIDPQRNQVNAPIISRDDSSVTVRVMPTDEDQMIARHTGQVLEIER